MVIKRYNTIQMEKLRKPARFYGQKNERKREQRQQQRAIHTLNPVEDAMDKTLGSEGNNQKELRSNKTRVQARFK
jgi:hypothetical protein